MQTPDHDTDHAIREIAALLATAYRRHHRTQRITTANTPEVLVGAGLASLPRESVHVHEVDA